MATIVKVVPKDGMTYDVTENGAEGIKLHYQVVLSGPMPATELITAFSDGTTAIPAINSEHPARPGMYVSKYSVTQPKDAAKHTLDVTVEYSATGASTDNTQDDPEGEPVATDNQVLEWGWDDGTSSRELVQDINGAPVVNSAHDPFDSVPEVETPAPTFTKVVKFATARNYAQYLCAVNANEVTIGSMTCPPNTLLCMVSEKMNIGDEVWPYTYTIRLKYRTNVVKRGGDTAVGEFGWCVAVVDAGMREIDDATGKLKLIQVVSQETGEPATVTAPELLDGHGHAVARSASGSPAEPWNLVFFPYKQVTFPAWFYSKPGNNVPTPDPQQAQT